MIWLYGLFVLLVFIVFIMQFVLVYEDDGISKVWAYRLFKFFQYGFRQDLNKVYDGKSKEQYEAEVNRVVEEVVELAQNGENYIMVCLNPELNDKDTDIVIDMLLKVLHKRFTNVFTISTYHSNCKGCNCLNIIWS